MGFSIRVDGKAVRLSSKLPLIPLRDVVVFPRMTLPLFVGRAASVGAIEQALSSKKILFAAAQRRPEVAQPRQADLYETGTLIRILQVFRLPDGTMRILVEGLARASISGLRDAGDYVEAKLEPLTESDADPREQRALLHRVQSQFAQYASLSRRVPDEIRATAVETQDPTEASYLVASQLLVKVGVRQDLLEAAGPGPRLKILSNYLATELDILLLEKKLEEPLSQLTKKRKGKGTLREQIRSASSDLGGEQAEGAAEIEELENSIRDARMPQAVEERALRELERLCRMPAFSPEATVTRSYIHWLTAMPWRKRTRDRKQIAEAQRILDEDHHGLDRVKERILEHLAVVQLSRKARGPILCLVGPPGVGKTSLGRSIARALDRRFVRMSLGGVRDEAEIRGHRRTYIGSMPGRIAQAMRRAGSINPVILLDEVDKLGMDYRGDPAAALLEVLDPEQNSCFNDHYLEVDYDLSNVLFLTTANTEEDIPYALRDRMEIIRLPGYLETEKKAIAEHFLLPRQIVANGLSPDDLSLSGEAIYKIVREYTREAGVRNLERELASVCRKTARRKASGDVDLPCHIVEEMIEPMLGVPRYTTSVLERAGRIGVANGLAWTQFGGEVLLIEVKTLPGKGSLILTGRLGDTMQESARAALSYVRSSAEELGIDPDFYRKHDLHIHVPDGGVPKDGPSAGVTIALALVSALTDRPTRSTVAVTGEITLRGKVLPVGGLTEKAVAAHRTGVRTLLVPESNRRNIEEIPDEVRKALKIIPVSSMAEVLRHGLVRIRGGQKESGKGKNSQDLYAA